MKVLIITGQLAKDMVKEYVEESDLVTEVIALPMPVAALLNTHYIARSLKSVDLKKYDIILVPGMAFGDAKNVEEEIGIRAFKGPKYAADLPWILDSIDKVELSTTIPACEVVERNLSASAQRLIEDVEARRDLLLQRKGNFEIGNVVFGEDLPIRIVAEITDVPDRSDEEIKAQARYFVSSGADIIDIGMISGENNPEDARHSVEVVRSVVNTPISIDTLNSAEAEAAVEAGAEMILSVDRSNCREMARFASECWVVVIPTDLDNQVFPKKVDERIQMLEDNIEYARKYGFKKIIGDLILDSIGTPGLAESLISYHNFRARNPDLPLLMGAANVTELIDADSIGVNALLAGLASEMNVSMILVTEVSNKARGSVSELSTASKMMFLAKRRRCPPKDLGIDLLRMKEKRSRSEPYDRSLEEVSRVYLGKKVDHPVMDPKGCFRILIDHDEGLIIAIHFKKMDESPDVVVKGRCSGELLRTLIGLDLVSLNDHAGYLGSEFQKAELALKTGRSYIQDVPLF